jgi:hypothetical protein
MYVVSLTLGLPAWAEAGKLISRISESTISWKDMFFMIIGFRMVIKDTTITGILKREKDSNI